LSLPRPQTSRAPCGKQQQGGSNVVATSAQTQGSITITATPAAVMAAIADFDAYPRWAAEVARAEVLDHDAEGRASRVRLLIASVAIRDDQILGYQWDGDRAVSWTLESSRMLRGLDGSYTLTPAATGTLV